MGNRWWANLKGSIRSFAADYSRRLKSARVAEQRSIKDKLDRAVLAGDSGQVNVAKAELASLQIMEYQALVVRARLKRMSCEATNMAQELLGRGAEACYRSAYRQCHIAGGAPSNYKRSHLWGVSAVFLEAFHQGARTEFCSVRRLSCRLPSPFGD